MFPRLWGDVGAADVPPRSRAPPPRLSSPCGDGPSPADGSPVSSSLGGGGGGLPPSHFQACLAAAFPAASPPLYKSSWPFKYIRAVFQVLISKRESGLRERVAAILASFSHFLFKKDHCTICFLGCPGLTCKGGRIWQQPPLSPAFLPPCPHPRGSCPRGHWPLN